jgi:RecB family exonuclease
MALTKDLRPCDFKSDDRWVRGIADLLIVDDDNLTARVVDWKTGNDKYPDRDQLTLMSLMVFAHFPHIRSVSSALVFIVKGSMVKHKMSYEDAEAAWWDYRERVAKLEAAHEFDVWNPSQSPLCGWCPVKDCTFNTKRS